jgi:hypothetical protein
MINFDMAGGIMDPYLCKQVRMIIKGTFLNQYLNHKGRITISKNAIDGVKIEWRFIGLKLKFTHFPDSKKAHYTLNRLLDVYF